MTQPVRRRLRWYSIACLLAGVSLLGISAYKTQPLLSGDYQVVSGEVTSVDPFSKSSSMSRGLARCEPVVTFFVNGNRYTARGDTEAPLSCQVKIGSEMEVRYNRTDIQRTASAIPYSASVQTVLFLASLGLGLLVAGTVEWWGGLVIKAVQRVT